MKSGLENLIGKRIFVMCLNYHYSGVLKAVNEATIQLSAPYLVYETGAWDRKQWQDVQKLPANDWFILISSIESFAQVDK